MDGTADRAPPVAPLESAAAKKKTAKKKPVPSTELASPLTSSRPTPSSGSQQIPKSLLPKIAHLLAKRDALRRDKAWLTSPSALMTGTGAARDGQQLLVSSEDSLLWSRDEVHVVEKSLSANGLSAEDNVSVGALACLLEQARRYALEILADAHDFASHRQKPASAHPLQCITPADIELAVDFKAGNDVSLTIPSLQVLAEDINRIPLPPIPTHCYNGIVLPDRHHQLTARTFDVVSSKRVKDRMGLGGNFPHVHDNATNHLFTKTSDGTCQDHTNTSKRRKTIKESSNTVYGAVKGKTIPVHLKLSVTAEPVTSSSDAGLTNTVDNPTLVIPSGFQ